ncbi:MAG: acyl carrier protein [Lachnospiraceae bacterium]|nr:acyl carrier protein [Lachnospiraceae bacterium]
MEYEVLKQAVKKALQVYDAEIQPESVFETELGADSIDMAQIFRLVEEQLNISIPKERISDVRTVRDAYELIRRVVAGHE